ncbi:metal-dependent hydrolase [Acinetobacter indicus]|jgi:predicted metal-dependent hydrolase|uniref:Metal-dependent hydrolase n=1 Tax=Acinetobacter indicus TaxID=756892 RepID=A0A6C0YL51_9GAMM|nr:MULTISPECIES: metal-dependent hydrolase [Acinetobacter]MDM1305224.1 metal-dependent hydrolase [Acinetobacter indicus]QIC69444.1 metal-dependent hydrolase [Acinetobacter indicus]QIC76753.1 metal-dependent hydrolase [Acinetobacter indicus]QLB60224.1 metal-dependent hydrolase [Acinetobacter indicus]QOW43472.1 metal-dependent hydrolase [Acinetobacter indicus]
MNAKVNITNRAGASFPVRRMAFEFDQVPEYWMRDSAGLTHFMTALSALFPAGEKFFIDSVRAVRYHPAIKDNQELQKEISAFIGQEAMHTQEHVGFNASAQKYGHDVERLDRYTDKVIQGARKVFAGVGKPFGITQEMVDLTATTALEHFTATIATQLLRNSHIQELMSDDTMKTMWLWHAIEENEHKAVAYDVFEGVFGQGTKAYLLRTSSLVAAMLTLFVVQNYFLFRLLKEDKQLNLEAFKAIYTYAYSPSKGIITGMGREMLAYFRPGFHPNDLDTVSLLDTWKAKLGF